MAQIKIDLSEPLLDGMDIKFKAPCDCADVTGMVVYYPAEDGTTASKTFSFKDSHGNDVTGLRNLFCEGSYVTVTMNVGENAAHLQNSGSFGTYTHNSTGLTGSGENGRFKATVSGTVSTISINGVAYSVKCGEDTSMELVAGCWYTFILDGSTINFNQGGGSSNKSQIIVTVDSGSTVTCTNGSITKTATEKNGTWTFKGLDLGTWTVTATLNGQTATQSVTLERLSIVYVALSYHLYPSAFNLASYGTKGVDYEVVQDDDTVIEEADYKNHENWKIRFLTSGNAPIVSSQPGKIDVFCVGGGGGGGNGVNGTSYGSGGGGGYTKTGVNVSIMAGTSYVITVGGGGATATAGGTTSAFGVTANGGAKGGNSDASGGNGGSGGGTGGNGTTTGGSDGGNGKSANNNPGGTGQGTTTREFGESNGTLYAGGGGGGCGLTDKNYSGGAGGGGKGAQTYYQSSNKTAAVAGETNTGGGGGGGGANSTNNMHIGKAGGSGIVIIRNARG